MDKHDRELREGEHKSSDDGETVFIFPADLTRRGGEFKKSSAIEKALVPIKLY